MAIILVFAAVVLLKKCHPSCYISLPIPSYTSLPAPLPPPPSSPSSSLLFPPLPSSFSLLYFFFYYFFFLQRKHFVLCQPEIYEDWADL